MARIAGVDLPKNKRIVIALTYVFGIGTSTACRILEQAKISERKRTGYLLDEEVTRIRNIIDSSFNVGGFLKRMELTNKKRLIDLNCYRGLRHRRGLPVRGQRTHTNAKTSRSKYSKVKKFKGW